jgi:hypothetical protein
MLSYRGTSEKSEILANSSSADSDSVRLESIFPMFDPSQPPLVSETLLKKRRSLDELALRRAATLQSQNKVGLSEFVYHHIGGC